MGGGMAKWWSTAFQVQVPETKRRKKRNSSETVCALQIQPAFLPNLTSWMQGCTSQREGMLAEIQTLIFSGFFLGGGSGI
jgi:hypothetical protein